MMLQLTIILSMFTSSFNCSTVFRASAILAMLLDIVYLAAKVSQSVAKNQIELLNKKYQYAKIIYIEHGYTFACAHKTWSVTVY